MYNIVIFIIEMMISRKFNCLNNLNVEFILLYYLTDSEYMMIMMILYDIKIDYLLKNI